MDPTLVLSALAVLLAGPVPTLLARARALRRVPRSAMVLWQAVALAAVLAGLGAGLSLVTGSVLRGGAGGGRYVVGLVALLVTATVLARLLLSGHRVGTRIRALRRRHLELLDLLATDDLDAVGVRVLEHDAPMAYCVPGAAVSRAAPRSRVVVSVATKRLLAPEELQAVLAHERAHLRARHDLVLEAFAVLHQAFPALVRSAVALGEVRFLVEVLADRAARRRAGARPLARALVALVDSRAPEAALGAGGGALAERVTLLGDEGRHPVLATATLAAAAAVLVLPTAFVALPWLGTLIP